MSGVGVEDSARNAPGEVERDFQVLNLADVGPSSLNPRKHFDEEHISALAEDIKLHGVMQPIEVRPRACLEQGPPYEIIMGECRYRASVMAGLTTIPAMVIVADDRMALERALVENIRRRDINPIEEADGYALLMKMGQKVKDIAAAVNRSPEAVSNAMRLRKLPDEIREMVGNGTVSIAHGKALLALMQYPKLLAFGLEQVKQGFTASRIEALRTDSWAYRDSGAAVNWCKTDIAGAEDCAKCDAKRQVGGVLMCCNPECYEQKKQDRLEAILAKHGKAGHPVLKLRDLPYGSYERLSSKPKGCKGNKCEHCTFGLDSSDTPVSICRKPSCYTRLINADSKAKRAAKRAQLVAEADTAVACLRMPISAKMAAAMVCASTVRFAKAGVIRRAAEALGVDVSPKDLSATYDSGDIRNLHETLIERNLLVEFTAAVLLYEDVEQAVASDYHKPDLIRWVLGQPIGEMVECPNCHGLFDSGRRGVCRYEGRAYCCEECGNAAHGGGKVRMEDGQVLVVGSERAGDVVSLHDAVDARCSGCDACVDGVGAALPSLTGPVCKESPGPEGTVQSVYVVTICPRGRTLGEMEDSDGE